MQRLDLVGQQFGRLLVLQQEGIDKNHNTLWSCKCSCGGERIVRGMDLKKGIIDSCGCTDAKKVDITKQRFGRLVAIRQERIEGRKYMWLFKCDCGNYAVLDRSGVVTGSAKSCGCLIVEAAQERAKKNVVKIDPLTLEILGENK